MIFFLLHMTVIMHIHVVNSFVSIALYICVHFHFRSPLKIDITFILVSWSIYSF